MNKSDEGQSIEFEALRIKELRDLQILDTQKEERYDRLTRIVSQVFSVPIALISLIDVKRQWFISCIGLNITSTPRDISICDYTIRQKSILHIPDITKNALFSRNPLAKSLNIRSYAGVTLYGPNGKPFGTLCIMDKKPRRLSKQKQSLLEQFARVVEHELTYKHHLKKLQKKVSSTLLQNPYTGLANERLFKAYLKKSMKTCKSKEKIAIFSLQINDFNLITHAYSDNKARSFVKELVQRISQFQEQSDYFAQCQDGTFLGCTKVVVGSFTLKEKINFLFHALKKPIHIDGKQIHFTYTLGISLYPHDSKSAETLIKNAVYIRNLNKTPEHTSFHFYSKEYAQQFEQNYKLAQKLRAAVINGLLELAFQPKVNTFTNKICGFEALCRWHDDEFGVVPPSVFIPLAEKSNLIDLLGAWVLKEACKQAHHWQRLYDDSLSVSVNVSHKQLLNPDFPQTVEKVVIETNLNPNTLELEITESSLIEVEKIIENINALSNLGVRFSLDDFGTGFASLSCLQKIPLRTLKIDKTFIDELNTKKNLLMVKAIINLAKALQLHVVSEGVESHEQYLILKKLKCDTIQGYFFSKPLSADRFHSLLKEHLK